MLPSGWTGCRRSGWWPRSAPSIPLFIDAANQDKLLILTAPSWFGEFVFGGTPESVYYTEANGQLGVALPPKWEADEQPYFGGQGGAAWAVSQHTQNPKLAIDLATWLATADEYQVDLAPDLPRLQATGRAVGHAHR